MAFFEKKILQAKVNTLCTLITILLTLTNKMEKAHTVLYTNPLFSFFIIGKVQYFHLSHVQKMGKNSTWRNISKPMQCMMIIYLILVTHSCPTLCNPIDSSPPGSPVPEILQARILE